MFFKSIRVTLTLWYSATLTVILLFFCGTFYLTIRAQLYEKIDRDLLSIAEALASPTFAPFRDTAPSVFDQVLEDFLGQKTAGKYIQILDERGRVDASTRNLQHATIPLARAALEAARAGQVHSETLRVTDLPLLRWVSYPADHDRKLVHIIRVATSLEGTAGTLNRILLIFTLSVPISLFLVAYGGWFLAGRALAPVELITSSAQRINAENLNIRLEVVNPADEIGRLATTFNDTLARLENSFIRIRRFSADVSHELRTPLTILRGESEVGLKYFNDPNEFRELLRNGLEEVNRMTEIIGYLLDLSRLEEGQLPLALEDVDLEALLEELVAQLRTLATERGAAISFTGGQPVMIYGDRFRLRQIFMNLVDNALKYTPYGEEVRVVLEQDSSRARITIADVGPGIAEKDLPFIFDRFYRVDEARNRAQGGTGLGLALVRSFTEAHGGTVEVQSRPGQGTVFTVFLPLSSP